MSEIVQDDVIRDLVNLKLGLREDYGEGKLSAVGVELVQEAKDALYLNLGFTASQLDTMHNNAQDIIDILDQEMRGL